MKKLDECLLFSIILSCIEWQLDVFIDEKTFSRQEKKSIKP
jgi:hypothetical protein